jgi:DNA-binding MarR family transcriptional regulator
MAETSVSERQLLITAIDRFWETYPPFWNAIRSHIREIATQKFAISVEQFHILRHINRGSASISELAEAKHISRPAISQAVDVLVNLGMITRVQETRDRRYVRLDLTEAGRSLLNAIFDDTRSWMAEKLSVLNDADLEKFIQGMETLQKTLD